jgi:hypothetical protein
MALGTLPTLEPSPWNVVGCSSLWATVRDNNEVGRDHLSQKTQMCVASELPRQLDTQPTPLHPC